MNSLIKLIPFLALTACINVSTDDKKGVTEAKVELNNSKIRNGIIIEEHGLKVEQAFLLYEDKTLVPETNITELKKKIKCRLVISDGWKEIDGKVFPGASEKIETSDGRVVLDEKDLFTDYSETGVSAEDGQFITLSAVINSVEMLYDFYLVKFKVWDKSSDAYVSGSFKFKVK